MTITVMMMDKLKNINYSETGNSIDLINKYYDNLIAQSSSSNSSMSNLSNTSSFSVENLVHQLKFAINKLVIDTLFANTSHSSLTNSLNGSFDNSSELICVNTNDNQSDTCKLISVLLNIKI